MRKGVFFIILITLLWSLYSCASYSVPENVRYDFTLRGPLTDDVFQVIVTAKPERDAVTQHEQRESAFITAKEHVTEECIRLIMQYYITEKKLDESSIPADKMIMLKNNFNEITEDAVIEQEYYLPDNSVVFVVRIYSAGIKSKILNY